MINKIIPIEEYFKEYKKVNLDDDMYNKFLNGVKFDIDTQDKFVRIYQNNIFRGLGVVEDKIMKRFLVE